MTRQSSPVLNLLRCDLGNLRRLQHRPREAVEILQTADNALAATAEGAGNAWRMDILAALSQAQLDNGDAVVAERSGDTALAIARRTLRPGQYQLGIALFALARAKLTLGKSTDAESLLREALEVRHPPHPVAIRVYSKCRSLSSTRCKHCNAREKRAHCAPKSSRCCERRRRPMHTTCLRASDQHPASPNTSCSG